MAYDYRADEARARSEANEAIALADWAIRDAAFVITHDGGGRWATYAKIAATHYRDRAHRARLAATTASHHAEAAGQ